MINHLKFQRARLTAEALLFSGALCLAARAHAADEICVYLKENGRMEQTNSRESIPARFRKDARCISARQTPEHLSAPEEIDLKGNIRRESISTSVGRFELRWPRKVELLFGRTPQRALSEAAGAVSRALKRGGFPVSLQNMHPDWQVIFLDEELPESQIPMSLISNCHPAWMTPPANLYVVGQRVAAGCGGSPSSEHRVADSQLAQVLIHEIGHAVEYQLLQGKFPQERALAEGFACWFEQYASDFSPVIGAGKVQGFYYGLARQSWRQSPDRFVFSGSAEDYARASMFFNAIVERRGIADLMAVYDVMGRDKIDFFSAAKKRLAWDEQRFAKEIERLLR